MSLFADSPRVSIPQQSLVVIQNEPFTLNCDMSLNPEYKSLSWYWGDEVVGGQIPTLTVGDGIPDDSQFRCEVKNKHGTGVAHTQVAVHCK